MFWPLRELQRVNIWSFNLSKITKQLRCYSKNVTSRKTDALKECSLKIYVLRIPSSVVMLHYPTHGLNECVRAT
jgi:hypothetical protein